MHMRSDTEGYQQGVAYLNNMFTDSRGPARTRGGARYISQFNGDDARIFALPVNDNFFYSALFLDQNLVISSLVGHNPNEEYTSNGSFNLGQSPWVSGDSGAGTSVLFEAGKVNMHIFGTSAEYAYVSQQFTVPATGNYRILWAYTGDTPVNFKVGTTEDGNDIYDDTAAVFTGSAVFNATSTTLWVTARIDKGAGPGGEQEIDLLYLGVTDEVVQQVEFTTPYLEQHLSGLQGIPDPGGNAFYIVHELYPPYKLLYDRQNDSFSWTIVNFSNQPPQWVAGSYPSAGDFFQGRLWLGGTVNEPQTFWASKSGQPENFDMGTGLDDEAIEFTLAKYGRIEWIVGFKLPHMVKDRSSVLYSKQEIDFLAICF